MPHHRREVIQRRLACPGDVVAHLRLLNSGTVRQFGLRDAGNFDGNSEALVELAVVEVVASASLSTFTFLRSLIVSSP